MSKANSAVKVLRTALKRVQTRWGQGAWSEQDDAGTWRVCLEGSITGGCSMPITTAQAEAMHFLNGAAYDIFTRIVDEIVADPSTDEVTRSWAERVIAFRCNDGEREQFHARRLNDLSFVTLEQAEETIKLALLRAETAPNDASDDELCEVVDDLIEGGLV